MSGKKLRHLGKGCRMSTGKGMKQYQPQEPKRVIVPEKQEVSVVVQHYFLTPRVPCSYPFLLERAKRIRERVTARPC
jgi:hypothetical protein